MWEGLTVQSCGHKVEKWQGLDFAVELSFNIIPEYYSSLPSQANLKTVDEAQATDS